MVTFASWVVMVTFGHRPKMCSFPWSMNTVCNRLHGSMSILTDHSDWCKCTSVQVRVGSCLCSNQRHFRLSQRIVSSSRHAADLQPSLLTRQTQLLSCICLNNIDLPNLASPVTTDQSSSVNRKSAAHIIARVYRSTEWPQSFYIYSPSTKYV